MENFAVIASYLFIGIILRRVPRLPEETGNVLNLFVIYVALPALVLLKIPYLEISTDLLAPLIMPWVMLLLSCTVLLLWARIFKWSRQIMGSLLLIVPLGNTSFLGIPMVRAFFGDQAVSYALLYDQLGSFLALATYGSLIIALYSGEKTPTPGNIVKKIITFPPFVALILACFFRLLSYPPVVIGLLESLSATLVPLVMIAVGFQLNLRLSRELMPPLGLGLLIKLIAAPFMALLFSRLWGLQGEALQVSVFEAGMPPMVSAGALAIMAGLAPSLTAAMVGLGIILSFFTLPLLYYFI